MVAYLHDQDQLILHCFIHDLVTWQHVHHGNRSSIVFECFRLFLRCIFNRSDTDLAKFSCIFHLIIYLRDLFIQMYMIQLVHSFPESLSLVPFFLILDHPFSLHSFLKKTSFHYNVKICHNVIQKKKTNKKRTFEIKRSSIVAVVNCFYFDYGTVSTS